MRVLFIQDNGINESLALCDLSAYLRQHGHQTNLLIEREQARLFDAARSYRPDVVLIPANILNSAWTIKITGAAKDAMPEIPVVLAGVMATFFPEGLAERTLADVLILGEAETPMMKLLQDLADHKEPKLRENLWIRTGDGWKRGLLKNALTDLERMPPSHRELYYKYEFIRKMPVKRFLSGRGCLHSCSYCFNPLLRRHCDPDSNLPFVRMRNSETILKEIERVRTVAGCRQIHFSDDLFPAFPEWVAEFTDRYRAECGLPFTINASADFVNKELVGHLARAGCRAVCMGVEVGDERKRYEILKKRISNEEYRLAACRIHEAGMKVVTYNMVALPGETAEEALKTASLNREMKTDLTHVYLAFPIPGTRMHTEAREAGLLPADIHDMDLEQAFTRNPGPIFVTDEKERLMTVYDGFGLASKSKRWSRLVARRRNRPSMPLRWILRVFYMLSLGKVFGLPLISGIRYYWHVGDVSNRTTVYHTLV